MMDRLTQLQVCLDQLVAQFNSTINYANTKSELALLDSSPSSIINLAASAPLWGKKETENKGVEVKIEPANGSVEANPGSIDPIENIGNGTTNNSNNNNHNDNRNDNKLGHSGKPSFEDVINELSMDLILKSRQISMIIDSLPGIGTLPETQLRMISVLMTELEETERERVEKMKEKDRLLKWCEDLIVDVSQGIYETRT